MNLIKSWNNRTIRFREDGYFCLTDMATANGKKVNDWQRLTSTKEYLQALESVAGIPATELINTIQGGTPEEQGTWAHRRVAIRFAQWCSPQFAVQVDSWVEELMEKGRVDLKPKTALELAKEQVKLLEELELKELQIKLLEEANQQQAEVIDELFDYSSIIRIAKFNDVSETNFAWSKLKAASKLMDKEIKVAPCPRFGKKNLYSHDVWRYCYPGYKLPETTTLVIQK